MAERRHALATVAIALLALAPLLITSTTPAYTGDAARDLLIARDCTELGRCHTLGATTTLFALGQGGLWTQVVAIVLLCGGALDALARVVVIAQAIAVLMLYRVATRWLAPVVGGLAAALYGVVLAWVGDHVVLSNQSLMPLLAVAACTALLVLARTGAATAALAGAFFIGIGAAIHPEATLLVPTLVVLTIAGCARPVVAGVAAIVVVVAAYAASSLEALRANLEVVAERRLWSLPLAALALAAIAGFVLRRRARNGDLVLAVVVLAPPLVGVLGLRALHHAVNAAYLHGALPVACVLAACAAKRLGRFAWAIPLLLAAAVVARPPNARAPEAWTGRELDAIGPRLLAAHPYPELKATLQGPGCRDLAIALSTIAPHPASVARAESARAPRVLRFRGTAPPATVPGERIALGAETIVHGEIESWLGPVRTHWCITPLVGEERDRNCSGFELDPRERPGDPRFQYAARAYPEAHRAIDLPMYRLEYVVPVEPVGAALRRVIRVIDKPPCAWRVSEVTGIDHDGALPSTSVTLTRSAGTTGSIVLAKDFGTPGCAGESPDLRNPPCLIEIAPEEMPYVEQALR